MRTSGTLLCLASAAAFGAMGVFGRLAYDDGATVGTLLAVRFVLAAALCWALVLARGELGSLSRRDALAALALGAVGYAAQAGGYFAALERIDPSLLALLVYTFPAIVAVAAVALGRERLDRAGSPPSWSCPRASRSSWRPPASASGTRSAPGSGSPPPWSTART